MTTYQTFSLSPSGPNSPIIGHIDAKGGVANLGTILGGVEIHNKPQPREMALDSFKVLDGSTFLIAVRSASRSIEATNFTESVCRALEASGAGVIRQGDHSGSYIPFIGIKIKVANTLESRRGAKLIERVFISKNIAVSYDGWVEQLDGYPTIMYIIVGESDS